MNLDPKQILNVPRLPGRVRGEEAAILLGFADHDLVPLVKAKMLTPLGGEALGPNSVKWFSSSEIEKLVQDPAWLAKATKVVIRYWREKNRQQKHRHGADNREQENTDGRNGELPSGVAWRG